MRSKLKTILTGIIGLCIAIYITDTFLDIDFVFSHSYFLLGGIILGVLMQSSK